MALDKTYVKRETVKGRAFRIEIYDDEWGFPYTRIIEELRPKKNFFDFTYEQKIAEYWIEDGSQRLLKAAEKIAEFIDEEEKEKEFERILDKWADEVL